MTRQTVGGQLDLAALLQLHRPPGAAQLADARHAAKQSLAALKAIDAGQVTGDQWQAIGHISSTLRDATGELDRLHQSLKSQRYLENFNSAVAIGPRDFRSSKRL